MMRNKVCFGIALIILVLLYLISSTDLFYKERENKIYKVSVILNETNSMIFENIKKGMKQVDKEKATEISIITLYEPNNAVHQMELLTKEIENGAEAIILFPVDTDYTQSYLKEKGYKIPIISVSAYLPNHIVDAWIHSNDEVSIEQLGEKIIEKNLQHVYTVIPQIEKENINQRLDLLKILLEKSNIHLKKIYYTTAEDMDVIMRQLNRSKESIGVIALDLMTFNRMMHTYREFEDKRIHIYGIGYTNRLLDDLEQGFIEAMAVYSDYDIGYLSIIAAIDLIEHRKVEYDQEVIGKLVTKDQIYEEDYEKILFPVH